MNTIVKKLRALPLFAKADEALLLEALAASPPVMHPEAGQLIEAPANTRALGVLLAGKAEILSADTAKSVVLRTLAAPAVFGAALLFSNEAEPFSRVVAATACEVVLLEKAAVQGLLEKDKGFLTAYLTLLCDRVRFLNEKIACFTAGSAERRLALWLADQNTDAPLPVSLSALSEMLDIGRASLYRALDKLTDEGFIQKQGRSIQLLDREKILEKYR